MNQNLTLQQAAKLLDEFYKGITTVAEEQQLLAFLQSPQCPPDMVPDRMVLEAATASAAGTDLATIEVPDGLNERVRQSFLKQWARRLFSQMTQWMGAAAAVAVVAVVALLRPPVTATVYADTCQTPREAAMATESTLIFLSHNLNLALEASESDLGGPRP